MKKTVHPSAVIDRHSAMTDSSPLDAGGDCAPIEATTSIDAGMAHALSALEPEGAHLAALNDALRARAEDGGDLDVGYRIVDSPLGTLLIAATPQGVCRLAFATESHEQVLDELAAEISPRIMRSPRRLDAAARELDAYWAGDVDGFTVPVDLSRVAGFRREVLDALRSIPYGSTRSYTQLAALAGRPSAVRAAGTACALNPIPLFVPCHRIIRSDGSTGAYRGGAPAKRRLLTWEAEHVAVGVAGSP